MPNEASLPSSSIDLSLERQLIESASRSHAQRFMDERKLGSTVDPRITQYMEMGFKRDQVALGLAYCQHSNLKEAEVVDFANNYRELFSMGYNPMLAAGALLRSNNDLTVATETCLTISS